MCSIRDKLHKGYFYQPSCYAKALVPSSSSSSFLHPAPSFLLRQRPHHRLKRHQRHCIRRKRPQKTRHKPPPVPPPPLLPVHRPRRIPPPREPPFRAQRIGHDALLDDVAGVGCDPKDLRGEAAGPEVDSGGGEGGVGIEEPGEGVVGAPPEAEEGAKEEGSAEAVPDAAEAVAFVLGRG